MFHELAQVTCVESLFRVFQMISKLFSFGITYKQCRILNNVVVLSLVISFILDHHIKFYQYIEKLKVKNVIVKSRKEKFVV